MQYTRYIDNLGRIVIPKDIRKNIDIKSSDALEIYQIKNKIIIQKKLIETSKRQKIEFIINAFNSCTENTYFYYQNNDIIGNKNKDYINQINSLIEDKSENKLVYLNNENNYMNIKNIVKDNQNTGKIIEISKNKIDNQKLNILKILIENEL